MASCIHLLKIKYKKESHTVTLPNFQSLELVTFKSVQIYKAGRNIIKGLKKTRNLEKQHESREGSWILPILKKTLLRTISQSFLFSSRHIYMSASIPHGPDLWVWLALSVTIDNNVGWFLGIVRTRHTYELKVCVTFDNSFCPLCAKKYR